MRARAEWHFAEGPEYCRGCAALGQDCGARCPYAEHAPASVEGAAVWSAANAAVVATPAGMDLDLTAALALARESGVTGWALAELLAAVRAGLAAGAEKRRAAVMDNKGEG